MSKVSNIVKDCKSKRLTTFSQPVLSRVMHWFSTGCQPLDVVAGGGIPVGRITEIFGDTSTGKSILTQHIMAEAQMAGATVVLFDTEATTDLELIKLIGVNPDDLIYSIPDTLEELYSDFEELLDIKRKEDPDGLMLIVWDSVAATSAEAEIEAIRKKGLGAATMGVHARTISQMCRVANGIMPKHNIAFVAVNQVRDKIGVLFGDNESTFGGRALEFYSSVRLRMKHLGKIKDKSTEEIIGINVRVDAVKNKIAPPFRHCEFPILFDSGIDEPASVQRWLTNAGHITGTGWKTLLLDGQELRFQSAKDWETIFYGKEDAIRGIVGSA